MFFVTVTDEKGHALQVSLAEFCGLCAEANIVAAVCHEGCDEAEEAPCETGEDNDDE